MSLDLLVTTPKKEMATAAQEAEDIKANGGGTYFRYLGRYRPSENVLPGCRMYYTENGFITGYAIITRFDRKHNQRCDTTKRMWPNGWYVECNAVTWKWIEPIPYKGFQGWRYMPEHLKEKVNIVGGWQDARPEPMRKK